MMEEKMEEKTLHYEVEENTDTGVKLHLQQFCLMLVFQHESTMTLQIVFA